MADDLLIRLPLHRQLVEQIIAGKMKRVGSFAEAKVGDYIEFYSAQPWAAGSDLFNHDPEPNALRVIIRVSKFEEGEKPSPNFIHWDCAVEKVASDPGSSSEENEIAILRALHGIGGDLSAYTPDEILAESTSLSLQDVKDYLDTLEEEGKVRHVVTTGGGSAFMQPRGRLALKEVRMATKPSSPAPDLDVLLTWSGTASHEIATYFHGWLPSVLPGIRPWISDQDIAKGKKWFPELMGQLSRTRISITFITPQNVRSPWIYFEVGMIAAKMDDGIVCPYLTGVEHSHVKDTPLGQYQWTEADKGDTWKLIWSINHQLGDKVHNDQLLEGNFSTHWPKLKRQIDRVLEALPPLKEDVVEVEPPIEQKLSEEARSILLAALQSKDGQITYITGPFATTINIDGKSIFGEDTPRHIAKWKAGFRELADYNLVEAVQYDSNVYTLTSGGFDVADLIKSRG